MIEISKYKLVLDPSSITLNDSACKTLINCLACTPLIEICVRGKVDSFTINCAYLRKLILVVLLFGFFCSCSSSKGSEIEIVGNIKNIPANKIYLTNAYQWDKFIDSSSIDKGRFRFVLETSIFKEPFLASLCILSESKVEQLFVVNYKRSTLKDTFANTGFMLSLGRTEFFGDYNNKYRRVHIKPNTENNLLFDDRIDNYFLKNDISAIRSEIHKSPSSYHLLYKIDQNKHRYSPALIRSFLDLFNAKIRESETAYLLREYAENITKKGVPYSNIVLSNIYGKDQALFNDSAKLYMLVFWASWCGPCRLEIPELKKIYSSFPTKQLQLINISIDQDRNKWMAALQEEKMEWSQYLVTQEDYVKRTAMFRVSAIPVVIFVDDSRREVKRFSGYSEDNIKSYYDFINNYLRR